MLKISHMHDCVGGGEVRKIKKKMNNLKLIVSTRMLPYIPSPPYAPSGFEKILTQKEQRKSVCVHMCMVLCNIFLE